MSGKSGDKLYYRMAALTTISFWAMAYAILWGKAEDGPGKAENARNTMLGRAVRTGQNTVASRKVVSPKKVEEKTAKKPEPKVSEVSVVNVRMIGVSRRRPVAVKSTNERTDNATGQAQPSEQQQQPPNSGESGTGLGA